MMTLQIGGCANKNPSFARIDLTHALHKALHHPPNKYLLNTYDICQAPC